MIITHLAVSGVGRFRSRHIVQGLGPGLNLLCAPNEAGKSTIFRALRAGLFYRHGSTEHEIKTLASLGAQLPIVVEIGFDRDGTAYRVHKSFLFNRSSRLFKAGQPIAEARVADEQVWSILGVSAGTRSADESTFGLLWVEQGASFQPIKPSDSARSALAGLIESEVGEVLGGARGERVRTSIATFIGREETTTGQPKSGGQWKTARENVESAREELDDARRTLELLDADLRMLTAKLEEERKLGDRSVMMRMQAELAAASHEKTSAEEAQRAAEMAEGEVARLKPTLELADKKHQDLLEVDGRITKSRARATELTAQLTERQTVHDDKLKVAQDREEELTEAADRYLVAEKEYDTIARISLAAADANRLADLRVRLERARSLREQIASKVEVSRQGISAVRLRKIEELMGDVANRSARLEAKAPQVAVQLGPEAGHRVRFQGDVIEAPVKSAALGPIRIEVDGIATIEVTPVSVPADMQALTEARANLDKELRKEGVLSVAEARQRRAATEDIDAERRGLSAELSTIAPDEDGQDGVAVLERVVVAAEANVAVATAGDAGPLPSAEELAARRQKAELRRDELRQEHRDREMALRAAQSDLAGEERRLAALRQELTTAEGSMRNDLETHPDVQRAEEIARLTTAVAEARREFAAAEEKANSLRAAVPSEEQRAVIAARIKRLGDAIEDHRRTLNQIAVDIAGLRERVAARGGQGLGEREATLVDKVAIAERELTRIERRIAAWHILRDAIEACRTEAREAYLAPIKTAMRPFLSSLFPGADTRLDENLAIEGLQRSGAELEPFDYLSHGTREQIAVLVRLALGRLLADREQPVPILLDDALVFSDDDRIECMFDALTQAAERHQVIVLTCRSRVFQTFGGRRLRIEPDGA
jgi:DNA repair exonuclease SbcCD ATPase subunit